MAGYYFNLPAITQLTIPQQAALNETRPIALSGGPGTGKSVVSLWRHINNYNRQHPKNSYLITFTSTLEHFLIGCCNTQNQIASQNINRSLKSQYKLRSHHFDEVIIDEAQDLQINYYQGIISPVSYGADESQIVYFPGSKKIELRKLFPNNVEYVLDKNFRNTKRILEFARQAFPNAVISQRTIDTTKAEGELPVLLISKGNKYDKTNNKQDYAICQIIKQFHNSPNQYNNIAILLPWKSDIPVFESVLNNNGIDYSVYYEDEKRFPNRFEGNLKDVHITTFKSAKGLEFDTVIIPNFHKYNEIHGQFNTDWEDFYVACTRTRSNLYLISNYDLPNLDTVTDKQVL